jgi:multicomponent Na+:H+ antiporter subunit D
VLFVAVSALTGGAVLRVAGRVYFGWGDRPADDQTSTTGSEENPETDPGPQQVRVTMIAPIVVLLLGALAVGLLPGAHEAIERAAGEFTDASAYAREALTGRAVPPGPTTPIGNWTTAGVLLDLLSAALAVGCAAIAMYGRRLRAPAGLLAGPKRTMDGLRRIHSGHVGDYVAWLMTGVTAMGALFGLPLR